MTLDHRSGNRTSLTECPYCEADIETVPTADHLTECEAFRSAWGHDAREAADPDTVGGPTPDAEA